MLIEFECSNQLDFDTAKNQPVACGKKLVVSEKQLGERIQCPRCKSTIQVPFEPPGTKTKRKPKNQKKSAKPRQPVTQGAPAEHDADDYGLSAPVDRPKDAMSYVFEDTDEKSVLAGSEDGCPKCGSSLDDFGNCTKCKFSKTVYESATTPFKKLKLKPAGFQKWFLATMSDQVSFSVVAFFFHAMMLFLTIAAFALSFVAPSPFGLILGVTSLVVGLTYMGMVFKGYQLASNPEAKLAWFQKPFWYGILLFARRLKWQGYDTRYKGRLILDLRNEPVSDDNVMSIKGLKKCSVLDLEGTKISDETLRELYGQSNLHCLVVRRTFVTHEGVVRLQQANPNLWIWY